MRTPDRGSPQYAIYKTKEMFESLTWDKLQNEASASTIKGTKVAVILDDLGQVLGKEIDISTDTYARMLICAGCAILAARKDCGEQAELN